MQHKSVYISQLNPSGRDGLEISGDKLLYLLRNKLDYLQTVQRVEGNCRISWYLVLVDSDKKNGFIENVNRGCRIEDYGIVISFGIGKIPEVISKTNFLDDILLIRLDKKNCYVWCKPGKKHEITEATSVDKIRRHGGQILHVANGADPPEAVLCEIIRGCVLGSNVQPIPICRTCQAVRNGDIQKVTEYLNEMQFPFNCIEQNGWTLLHHAAHCGNLDIIRLLVAKGHDIHARDTTCGRLAAHIAAREGHTETVEYFLNKGVSVDETDKVGWTMLHYATWKSSSQTVRLLIKNGARVNIKDKCLGKTPLHVGSEEGHVEVIEILLDFGADIDDCDDNCRTAINIAAYQGCIETVRFLFDRNANVEIGETVFGAKPLHVAAFRDSVDVLEFFLDQGADIQSVSSQFSLTPLHFAAMNGSLNSTRLLVARGADLDAVDINGLTPFDHTDDHMDVALYLSVELIKKFQIQGNCDDVMNIYMKLLEFQKEKLGPDHTETLDTRSNMAKVMYEQGQYVEALDILRDVHARRGCSSKDALLTKCELRVSIREAQMQFYKTMEDLKEVFQKCETDLAADQDVHDPLNVACDIASVYLRNHEYDKMFNILNSVLEQKETPLSVVQTAALRKSSGDSQENRTEGLDSQRAKHILEKVICVCVCIMVSIAWFVLDFRL